MFCYIEVTYKENKRLLPMINSSKPTDTNPHMWSILLAAAFVLAIISPVGQMAARMAGY
jgi:uncharacterized membrane protein